MGASLFARCSFFGVFFAGGEDDEREAQAPNVRHRQRVGRRRILGKSRQEQRPLAVGFLSHLP